jgi:type IV pilus assembly protein PilB
VKAEKKLQINLLGRIAHDETLHIAEEFTNYDEPVIKFVNHVIQHALQQTASDIHIEPYTAHCRIRYRRDGILHEVAEVPSHLASRLVSRLKVMAKLDIAERRLPQDGRLQLHGMDIRVSTCPTLFGEKIVLRLLDPQKMSLNIDHLGFDDTQKKLFLSKIKQPQGMILVTGPTGSGKTVTLYSALHHLNTAEKNISTVEDPIEIQLTGINQVPVNPKIGLDFATVLRTFLRQDPDILMVGEIRDKETATIAIQAAQTGHLVLSTLHTNSALETITRLHSMGIEPYNIVSAVSLVIAQRLVRKLCTACKQPERIGKEIFFRANGCDHCLQGYSGRTGIYELLPITTEITEPILNGTYLSQAHDSLYQAGLEKVHQGITSLSEIHRVIQQ